MKSQKLICFHLGKPKVLFLILSLEKKILTSIASSIKMKIIIHTHLYNEVGII